MKKEISILPLLLIFPGLLFAQHSLEKETTAPRARDEFVKTEMEFFPVEKIKETGNKEMKIWDLRKLKEKEKKKIYKLKIKTGNEEQEAVVEEILPDYKVSNFDNEKGIILTDENNTFFQRQISGDSLFETGYENPTTRVRYSQPQLLMKFPMELSDELHSEFSGRGIKDDRLASVHYGTVITAVDAFGQLILPSGDTLAAVVRAYESKEEKIRYEPLYGRFNIDVPVNSLEKSGNPDEVITTDTYRWYEEGYRYPVFETIQSYRTEKNKSIPILEVSYFYAPYKQGFLKKDPANEKIKNDKKKNNSI